jgi:hypothetical protein
MLASRTHIKQLDICGDALRVMIIVNLDALWELASLDGSLRMCICEL